MSSDGSVELVQTVAVATDKSHHLTGGKGFQNPWPSWAKPSLYEVWSGLSWTEQFQHLDDQGEKLAADSKSSEVQVLPTPDFSAGDQDGKVRTWWLGHAGVLIQFPPSTPGQEPLRILFDPIFSQRCSPSQWWGPVRFFPTPCTVKDLPSVHVVFISHNHYDHLDANTITELWQANKDHMRFVLPLGNMQWMESLLGKDCRDRIWEADWWDEAVIWRRPESQDSPATDDDIKTSISSSQTTLKPESSVPEGLEHLRVVCTPAQHGSGRYGLDTMSTLWASYHLFFHPAPLSSKASSSSSSSAQPFHVFFGGDTGYRLRPPPPSLPFPPCPAFQEMHEKFGVPNLLLLPVSIGSTYSYIKSWDIVGALPHIDGGLMAQNHLDEWQALDVARVLCGQSQGLESENDIDSRTIPLKDRLPSTTAPIKNTSTSSNRSVALAIHFGTFCTKEETRRTMQQLRKACGYHSWRYSRGYDPKEGTDPHSNGTFVVLDHGGYIDMDLS